MQVTVKRKDIKFLPDSSRVVARFFNNGDIRTRELVKRVVSLDDADVDRELEHTLREFAGRHRNISKIFLRHFDNHKGLIEEMGLKTDALSHKQKLLFGSYATMEYSIESAAMFNPSIIEDFDQSFLATGEKRVIISFRATGEGHLSSIVFRRGVLDANNDFHPYKVRNHIDMATIVQKKSYDKGRFVQKLREMKISEQYSSAIMNDLPDHFEYHELKSSLNNVLSNGISTGKRLVLEEMTWLVDSY